MFNYDIASHVFKIDFLFFHQKKANSKTNIGIAPVTRDNVSNLIANKSSFDLKFINSAGGNV